MQSPQAAYTATEVPHTRSESVAAQVRLSLRHTLETVLQVIDNVR